MFILTDLVLAPAVTALAFCRNTMSGLKKVCQRNPELHRGVEDWTEVNSWFVSTYGLVICVVLATFCILNYC